MITSVKYNVIVDVERDAATLNDILHILMDYIAVVGDIAGRHERINRFNINDLASHVERLMCHLIVNLYEESVLSNLPPSVTFIRHRSGLLN